MAFADSDAGAVKVFSSLTGSEIAEILTDSEAVSISWFGTVIAVGTAKGVELFRIKH